tara:strand:- start:489 stop:647 length:159 start_codon:yes stop_codon:yes gene_type:complete
MFCQTALAGDDVSNNVWQNTGVCALAAPYAALEKTWLLRQNLAFSSLQPSTA